MRQPLIIDAASAIPEYERGGYVVDKHQSPPRACTPSQPRADGAPQRPHVIVHRWTAGGAPDLFALASGRTGGALAIEPFAPVSCVALHRALVHLVHEGRVAELAAMLDRDQVCVEVVRADGTREHADGHEAALRLLADSSARLGCEGRIAHVEPISLASRLSPRTGTPHAQTRALFRSRGARPLPPAGPRRAPSPASRGARRPPVRVSDRIDWTPTGRIARLLRDEAAPLSHGEWAAALATGERWRDLIGWLAECVEYTAPTGNAASGRRAVAEALGALALRLRGCVRAISAETRLADGGATRVTLEGDWTAVGASKAIGRQLALEETLTWAPRPGSGRSDGGGSASDVCLIVAISHRYVTAAAPASAEGGPRQPARAPRGRGGGLARPPRSPAALAPYRAGAADAALSSARGHPPALRAAARPASAAAGPPSRRAHVAHGSAQPAREHTARAAAPGQPRAQPGARCDAAAASGESEAQHSAATSAEQRAAHNRRRLELLHGSLVRASHACALAELAAALAPDVRLLVRESVGAAVGGAGGGVEETCAHGRDVVARALCASAIAMRARGGVLRSEPARAAGARRTVVGYTVGGAAGAPGGAGGAADDERKVEESVVWDGRGHVLTLERTAGAPLSHHDLVFFQHAPRLEPPRDVAQHGGAREAAAQGGAEPCEPRVVALLAADVTYEVRGVGRWEGRDAVAAQLAREIRPMRGRIAVISAPLRIGERRTEIAFAGFWRTPWRHAAGEGRASAPGGGDEGDASGGPARDEPPMTCVLEQVEWTASAEADELDGTASRAQPLVQKLTRIALPSLHPELADDWRRHMASLALARVAGAALQFPASDSRAS
jgi:hypothetical protein